MTLKKLACLAGSSIGTVSKAFSGSKEISEETRERIFALAKEHDCFDKYYKSPRQRPLIALMPPEPESEYYGREIGMLERAISSRGADTIITFTRFDREYEARMFRELAYRMKVDGIVIWGGGELISNPDALPLVLITQARPKNKNADTVKIDFNGGISELVGTLKDYGHKKVGYIGEKLTVSKERELKNAMRKAGIPVLDEYFMLSESRFAEAGEDGMRKLISQNDLPDVIVAAYDQIAYGAIKVAREKGLRVPDDISFVGMDDISPTPYFDIPLSSLYIDFKDACDKIVDLVFKRIENRHYREREAITVPVRLNVRESLKFAK